jgi:hypothetical protein
VPVARRTYDIPSQCNSSDRQIRDLWSHPIWDLETTVLRTRRKIVRLLTSVPPSQADRLWSRQEDRIRKVQALRCSLGMRKLIALLIGCISYDATVSKGRADVPGACDFGRPTNCHPCNKLVPNSLPCSEVRRSYFSWGFLEPLQDISRSSQTP